MIDVIWITLPFLLDGLWMTIKISLITIICGSLLGFVVGIPKTKKGAEVSPRALCPGSVSDQKSIRTPARRP